MTTEAVHPPIKHIIENDATGDNGHLPFARLKLKPVNRMSCIIDYDSSTLERKKNGLGKLQSRAGLSITGGQQGAHGGKCQNKSSNKTLGQCFVCLEAATLQCTWCGEAEVCSEAHLSIHRPNTKCLPFKVSNIGSKGRGLVATRSIRARETILTESPALCGPSLMTSPVCPTCLAPVRPPMLPCSTCSLPVCSPVCQQSPVHKLECRLLSENKVKVNITDCDTIAPIYSFIMPYRLLMLRHVSQDTWGRVARLPDHILKRAGTGEWDVHQKEIVNFLRRRCFLSKKFSDEDIHRAIGIISINSVSLEPRRLFSGPSKGRTGITGRGIFPTFALCNHSCVGNARFSLDSNNNIRLEARDNIKQGQEISVQYYSSLLGTHKRRRRLRSEWYFDCSCERCVDPTELGTMVSAVLCEACETGYLLPKDPLDVYSEWPCSQCDFFLEVPDLERKIDQLEEELNFLSAKKDLRKLENFINDLSSKVLHPQHYLLLIARRNYKYISQKQLISELARCEKQSQEQVKEAFRKRLEQMSKYDWVSKLLLGEDS